MSEGTSSRKPADQEGERASDQVIRLDSQREQRRGNTTPVVEDDELEAPVAPEPVAEAPSAQPKPASSLVSRSISARGFPRITGRE